MAKGAVWFCNTDETEEVGAGAYRKMIRRKCIAAWGSCNGKGPEKTLRKPKDGDTVFLYCAGRGIVATGTVEGKTVSSTKIFDTDDVHNEFTRSVPNLKELQKPLSLATILSKTGYYLPCRHTVCRLKNQEAILFINKQAGIRS